MTLILPGAATRDSAPAQESNSLHQGDALTRHRQAVPALTGIRFLAAFYVVLAHSLPWLNKHFRLPGPMKTFLGNGYLAVGLFFLLSGFILAYTYEGQIKGAGRKRFWEARFARIYPVYFLSLILAYWFERGLHITTRVAVLCMVQAWDPLHPALAGAWNYPAWSLSVEAFFYVCFPFVLPWVSHRTVRTLRIIFVALMAVSVFGRTPVMGLGTWDHSTIITGNLPLPILRIPEFFLGVTLGVLFLRRDREAIHPVRAYASALGALILLCVPIGKWVSLVMLPFAVLVYHLALGRSWIARVLSTRAMVLLGGASYSVYLLQYPVRSWTRVLFSYAPGKLQSLGAPLTPLILVLFSILVFQFLEEPSRKALRSWFAAGRRPRVKEASSPSAANGN